jgi:LysM repeat protein
MRKTPAPPTAGPRLCPTCGTRVGAAATKCLVCGTDLTAATGPGRSASGRALAVPRFGSPNVLLFALLGVLALVGISLVYMAASGGIGNILNRGTPTPTPTITPLPSATLTPTLTETPIPTPTPLPPTPYTVVANDTCLKIAADFHVSVQSIQDANPGLNCNLLSVGQVLQVPQPTPTPTALPTATNQAGVVQGPTPTFYTVRPGETCVLIANVYHITVEDLMAANNIADCQTQLRQGMVLSIPVEKAIAPGPTPTASPPPPYPAPNLLLPNDGQWFKPEEATVTLQWTTVGELRAGEYYQIMIEDVTCQCARVEQQVTTETKFIIPADFRPTDGRVHTYRWHVTTVRQRNPGEASSPVYDSAGATSPDRIFSWSSGAPAP